VRKYAVNPRTLKTAAEKKGREEYAKVYDGMRPKPEVKKVA